jgi:hypothetical protein
VTKDDEVTETKIDLDLAKIVEEIDALIKSERGVKLLGDALEVRAAIRYENGVQWIDELLAEKETEDDE